MTRKRGMCCIEKCVCVCEGGGGGYSDEKLLPVETVHSYTFPCIGTATTSVGNGGYSSLEICDEGRNNHLEIDDEGRNSSLEISDEG